MREMDLETVTALLPAPDASWEPGDAWLAGGTWLFSEPQPQVRRLLDLRAFGWPALALTGEGGLEIGATCTLAELARFRPLPSWNAWSIVWPVVDSLLGSFKVMNVATVGGNLCLALPAGPIAALATALDATCVIWTPTGTVRTVPARDFVTGVSATVLAPGELLRTLRVPRTALESRCVVRRASLSAHGRSAALVVGRVAASGEVTLTVTASLPHPVELRFPGLPAADVALAALAAVRPAWLDDIHGLARWRAAMTARLVAQTLGELSSPEATP
jgi:CO/xanthine dehydrogenase FAD-binding subunit